MGSLTEVRQHGPRVSYTEYLDAEMIRTGLSREEIQARDKQDSDEAIAHGRKAAAELDAKRAREAS